MFRSYMARGFSMKGVTLRNVAFALGVGTFTFLTYAFIAPRLITPAPTPAPEVPNKPLPSAERMGYLPAASANGGGMTLPEIQRVSGYARGYQARSNVFPSTRRLNLS